MVIRRKVSNDKKTVKVEDPQVPEVKRSNLVKLASKKKPVKTSPSGERPRRFYRSNLSTIVWDAVKNKPLADFSQGHFTTEDPEVAEKLVKMGYVEIPLNCERPPDIIVNQPSLVLKQAHVPILSPGLNPTQAQNRISAVSEEI